MTVVEHRRNGRIGRDAPVIPPSAAVGGRGRADAPGPLSIEDERRRRRLRPAGRSVRETDTESGREVIVVGGGIAGLVAAAHVRELDLEVSVFEEAPEVGGRLATRPVADGLADSGAQFFTARSTTFRNLVDTWMRRGIAYEWSRGWTDQSLDLTTRPGHPRYAVHGGMRALAETLAEDLDVRTGLRVTAIRRTSFGWDVEDGRERTHRAKAVLLTPPVPLALALLNAGLVELAPREREILERIEYAPCLSGMFAVTGRTSLPAPGAVQSVDDDVIWTADNHEKGISPQQTVVTMHMSPEASCRLWTASDERIGRQMRRSLRTYVADGGEELAFRIDRWEFALPVTVHDERCLVASSAPPLVFAGDAFGGPRVEGAVLSGLSAAEDIARLLHDAG